MGAGDTISFVDRFINEIVLLYLVNKNIKGDETKMRTTNIREIPQSILSSEHIEDPDYFKYLCEEASATGAFEFFEIDYDAAAETISILDTFDIQEAIEVVERYFEHVNEDEDTYKAYNQTDIRAKAYDEHTESLRGADDGTFDYAGTFVMSILSVLHALYS